MYKYSEHSKKERDTLHPKLRSLCDHLISVRDVRVNGWRDEETQTKYYRNGDSEVEFPNSRHNRSLIMGVLNKSDAVDFEIFVNNKLTFDPKYYIELNGHIQTWAMNNGCKITWGGNWDNDQVIIDDQKFQDLMHWQLESVS